MFLGFRKAAGGPNPYILDTSALIDGRLEALFPGLLRARLIVPSRVLEELVVFDRSTSMTYALQREQSKAALSWLDGADHELASAHSSLAADDQVVAVAEDVSGVVVSHDKAVLTNATLRDVETLYLDSLGMQLRPRYRVGQTMRIKLRYKGHRAAGIGILPSGEHVTVLGAAEHIGKNMQIELTRVGELAARRAIQAKLVELGSSCDGYRSSSTNH